MKGLMYVLMICGAALAAVVAAVRYLKLPQEYVWYTAILLGVIVAIAGVVTFVRFLQGKRDRLAKAGPKVSQEELDFQARVRAFAATLKQLERHQRATAPARPRLLAARFEAPWVAVLGLQGHGKTRLLGGPHPKKLPEIDQDGPVKGADASAAPDDRPRCLSAPGQAVFLEVPHALAHREDLRRSWQAELGLLVRRSQPLHALVLCVAADDLTLAPEPAARGAEIGDLLAAEVQDIVTALQVHVPVFLVVTRLDRLSGFHDVLGSFEQVAQPLGFELPDGRSEELALKELRSRYDALCGWLDRRALRLLSRFRDPDAPRQTRIYTFVQQVAGLQEGVAAIAARVLAARGGDPVRLRGVFLTSALQDGEPVVDAVLERLAKQTGGSFAPALPDAGAASRRIFAEELVGTAVLRDARLSRRTERAAQRATIRRAAAGAALGLVGLWVGVGSTGSAGRNRDMAQETADAAAETKAELGGRRSTPVEIGKIAALRELLARWEDESGEDTGDVRGWGLFRDEVVAPLQRFYKRAVLAGVVEVLREKAESDLRDFANRFESPDLIPEVEERTKHRDTLRLYLLTTRDKKPYEKQPISQEADWLRGALQLRWSAGARAETGKDDYQAILRAVDRFIRLAEDADFKLDRDQALIEQTQEILKRETSVRGEVEAIVEKVSAREDLPKINLRTVSGIPDIENDGTEVRGAFTVDGWKVVYGELGQATESDAWVLGFEETLAKARSRKRGADMRTVYFDMYMKEWQRFIQRMRIVPPSSLDSGRQLMAELTRGRPLMPLGKVFAELKKHTELGDDYNYEGSGGLLDAFKGGKDKNRGGLVRAQEVKEEFVRLTRFAVAEAGKEGTSSLDQYHELLKGVRDAIVRALEDKEEEKALVEQLKKAIDDTTALVQDGELDVWTAGTKKLLLAPLEELYKMLVRDQGTGAVQDWCARIVDPMHERFGGRYPFDPESRSDAAVADFEEFFHPENGVIRKAREELLTSYVVLNGSTVEPRDRGRNDGPKLDPAVVRFLNRAQDIGAVMFQNEELRVEFDLILACNPQVSHVEVTIEGKKVEFRCGQDKPTRLRWPGKEDHGASLKATGKQGNKLLPFSGEWGLFELLEKPPSTVPDFKGEDVILFVFDMTQYNLGQLPLRVKPVRVRNGTAFFGLPNGSRTYLSLIRAPDVLPPKRLFSNMAACEG